MRKILAALSLSLSTTLIATPVLSDEDIDLLARGSTGGPSAAYTLNQVSSKPDAIKFLQDLKEPYYRNGKMISPSNAGQMLSNLGYRKNLETLYNAYLSEQKETEKARIFVYGIEKVSSPILLAVMGDDINKNGEKIYILSETTDVGYNVPFGNAYIILRIVERSKFFPPDAVSWVKEVRSRYGSGSPDLYLSDMRAFWAENGEFIKAGEYSRVRPPSARTAIPTSQPTTVLHPAQPAAKSTPDIEKLAAATTTTPLPARQADTSHIKPVWWTAGIIATLITAALALRKKAQKTKDRARTNR